MKKKEESGPWNKKDGERSNSSETESPVVESKPLPGTAAVVMEQPNVVGGAYVPPQMRGREGAAPPSAVEARKPPRR